MKTNSKLVPELWLELIKVLDQFVKLISSKSSVRGGRLEEQRNERVYQGVWSRDIRENIWEDWLV